LYNDITPFGTDIKIDNNFYPLVANNGELITISSIDTALQDIYLLLVTKKGSLFYDKEFGSDLPDIINNDELIEDDIENSVISALETDIRIDLNTIKVKATQDVGILRLDISFNLLADDTPYNILIPNIYEALAL